MNLEQSMGGRRGLAHKNDSISWNIAVCVLLAAFALSIIMPGRLFADELSHRKKAEEFMVLVETEKMMAGSFDQLKSMETEKLGTVAYPGKNPEKDKELKKRVADYLDERLNWNNFKDSSIDVYAKLFTEEELKILVDFYSSPVGRKVVDNAQDLRLQLLKAAQVQMKGMTFEIRKIEKAFVSEQKK
jgi:uncharacterized protein